MIKQQPGTYPDYEQILSATAIPRWYTSSRLITEVKQRRAWLVLGWVTAWEHHSFPFLILKSISFQLTMIKQQPGTYPDYEQILSATAIPRWYTSSRLITEVKQRRAWLVLG
ncbi:hypothetical protein ABEB36_000470 [Hypothenemus hampei]|uniref:Uncharacterized protein n=1 Tax=Hypothenemus hampei TaxID=57062 RepID=A0ABD1FBB4_HYPHA